MCVNKSPRIVSLLASATEIVCALGAQDSLVGVSHGCDFPAGVSKLPHLTKSIVGPNLTSRQVDDLVSAASKEGRSLYELDEKLLQALSPELVITQELCDVCAVGFATVASALGSLKSKAQLVSLQPGSIEEILIDVSKVGAAIGAEVQAQALVDDAHRRLQVLKERVQSLPSPKVLTLEWFDPAFFGGHWVPEQVKHAGGISLIGKSHERSERMSWEQVNALDPDIILLMPCGYDLKGCVSLAKELDSTPTWGNLRAVRSKNVWALDANSFFSRPSPRVITGAEILGHIFHPEHVPCPTDVDSHQRLIE